jgi:hypothetical protein
MSKAIDPSQSCAAPSPLGAWWNCEGQPYPVDRRKCENACVAQFSLRRSGSEMIAAMETPDPDEEPLGTVRAYAAAQDLPPRAPEQRTARTGPVLLVLAFVLLVAGGAVVAWRLADRASSPSATAPGARTTASKGGARAAAAGSGSRSAASRSRSAASRSRSAAPRSRSAAPTSARGSVVAVGRVLAFAGAGRAAAQRGDWAAALRNRQATLARLARVRAAGPVAASLGFLRAALQASVKADQARVTCGCGAENPQDVAATELKRRFLDAFNPLASRYLGRTYSEPDI